MSTKRWVFTLNNPQPQDETDIKSSMGLHFEYLVYGRERGDSGTPHLQGACVYKNRVSLRICKTVIPRAHWEKARCHDFKKAIDYCKKDGDWFEEGVPPTQGKRNDLEAIKEEITQGTSELEIANTYFGRWCIYRRSFQSFRSLLIKPRNWKPYVECLWGNTGLGKTRFVHHMYGTDNIYTWVGGTWFDGYMGQPVALFDDYRGEIDISLFLRILDRYALRLPVKGGFVEWAPRKIFITSNEHPNFWYEELHIRTWQALERRIKITHVEQDIFID